MTDLSKEKEITVVTGSPEYLPTYIYNVEESYTWVREAHFDTGKGGEPIVIGHFTDPHFNYLNYEDFMEKNPSVMSSYENRIWLRNAHTIDVVQRCLEFCRDFDQTVITGDVLDYLTHGAIELMHKIIWDKYPNTIITTGNHEYSRTCEGKVEDPTPLSERIEILKAAWRHDMFYYSRLLGDKVLVVSIDDGCSRFTKEQYEKLEADIKRSRENGYIMLLFMHEPLCTYNPLEKAVDSLVILSNDDRNHCDMNFCATGVGSAGSDEDTLSFHRLMTRSPDVIKGVFTGHYHTNFYTEIIAQNPDGSPAVIPQYVLTTTATFDHPNIIKIVVK